MAKRQALWYDIRTASRGDLAVSFAQERHRIVTLLNQIAYDMEHWNELHPNEQPLQISVDFYNDIIERHLADGFAYRSSALREKEGPRHRG